MEDLVSIIIPVYNAEKYIRQTIENIQNQTYTKWELILVEDVSEDNSYEIIKSWESEKIKVIQLEKHSGPAIARNAGIKLAKGRYIAFQDADDLWALDKLEKQLKWMQEKEYAFTYTAYQYIKKGGRLSKKIEVPEQLTYLQALKDVRILSISVILDSKKITKEQMQMLDVKSEDVATWWNILKQGYKAYGLNEVLVYYRRGEKTLTSNKLTWWKNRWNLYRRVEKLSWAKSLYYFSFYLMYGIWKRIG